MKCRCLATAPKKCGQPLTAGPSGLCEWCEAGPVCAITHRRLAIAAVWQATWRRAGRRWGR